MDQYESQVFALPQDAHYEELARVLTRLGKEGWHSPLRVSDGRYILQRKIPPLPPSQERENENPCLIN